MPEKSINDINEMNLISLISLIHVNMCNIPLCTKLTVAAFLGQVVAATAHVVVSAAHGHVVHGSGHGRRLQAAGTTGAAGGGRAVHGVATAAEGVEARDEAGVVLEAGKANNNLVGHFMNPTNLGHLESVQ